MWAEFVHLGPGYESLLHIYRERPHSDEWLRQRTEARRRERGLPARAAAQSASAHVAPRPAPEYQPIDRGAGDDYFANFSPAQLFSRDQRTALWQFRTLLGFLNLPYIRASDTVGTLSDAMVMSLLIPHSVAADTFIRLELGPDHLLLTWPLGRDDNGGRWTRRVLDIVEGLLHGHNKQIIIRRGGRVVESTTMVVTDDCRRQASVYRPRRGISNAAISALAGTRMVTTRRIRFAAEGPFAPQQMLLDVSTPHQADQWRQLGCSRAAGRYARSRFYPKRSGRHRQVHSGHRGQHAAVGP